MPVIAKNGLCDCRKYKMYKTIKPNLFRILGEVYENQKSVFKYLYKSNFEILYKMHISDTLEITRFFTIYSIIFLFLDSMFLQVF